MATRVGAYPGSFDPPTVAHLAIAEAAVGAHRLDRLDLVVSRRPFDKEHVEVPSLAHRLEVLEHVAAGRPWLAVVVTDHRLLADIAEGYDVLVVGADKYAQLHDVGYYDDEAAMAAALARLPALAVAPRPPHPVPAQLALTVDLAHAAVSSSAARAGATELMLPEAAAFDARTGAWSDPERYRRRLTDRS
jgi:nicotinic acid mononucleotide adenylyltransferase